MKPEKIIKQTRKRYKITWLRKHREWNCMEVNTAYQHAITDRPQCTNAGYTAINITNPLQYFPLARLARSTNINISHTINISSSSNNTQQEFTNSHLQHNWLAGTQAWPSQFRRSRIGNGKSLPNARIRRRECDVQRKQNFVLQKTKTKLFSNRGTFPTPGLSCN